MHAAEALAEIQGRFKRVNQAGLLIRADAQAVGYQFERGMISNEFGCNLDTVGIVQRPVECLAFQALLNFLRADTGPGGNRERECYYEAQPEMAL